MDNWEGYAGSILARAGVFRPPVMRAASAITKKCLVQIMRSDRSDLTYGWEKHWDEVLDSTAMGSFR
ncbi:hypothetical protein [Streptomyces sp. NPDC090135]|uniref:hypothetical protein n=1 Tax=Streptomyces sp. NPDC090135 TaxID=3365957 RepID=UPI00380CA6CB